MKICKIISTISIMALAIIGSYVFVNLILLVWRLI